MKPTIALCMIVKDEETDLERSIQSAAPWVDEIVVVDTGSTDSTVEVARRAGACVDSFAFTNGVDLGAARTHSLNLAESDWALLLDGDTTLDPASGPLLKEAVSRQMAAPAVICALWKNYYGSGEEFNYGFTKALLPLAPGRRLIGRRHEYFVDVDGSMVPWVLQPEIVVHHWGFTSNAMLGKNTGRTNLDSALLQLQEAPEYGEFWFDAIRAHSGPQLHESGLELIGRYRRAVEQGEVRHASWHFEFRTGFYEAVFAFEVDQYERAFHAASASMKISESRDMFAVRAAVNAIRGNDGAACADMFAADKHDNEPHPMIGGSEGMSVTSKMLCFAAGAAERRGEAELAFRWYTRAMSTVPTYYDGPVRFASFLSRCGRADLAAALLREALDANPDDRQFATMLVDLWRGERGVDLADHASEARGRWPTNPVFAA